MQKHKTALALDLTVADAHRILRQCVPGVQVVVTVNPKVWTGEFVLYAKAITLHCGLDETVVVPQWVREAIVPLVGPAGLPLREIKYLAKLLRNLSILDWWNDRFKECTEAEKREQRVWSETAWLKDVADDVAQWLHYDEYTAEQLDTPPDAAMDISVVTMPAYRYESQRVRVLLDAFAGRTGDIPVLLLHSDGSVERRSIMEALLVS
jgi:hypothetical protein